MNIFGIIKFKIENIYYIHLVLQSIYIMLFIQRSILYILTYANASYLQGLFFQLKPTYEDTD